VARLKSTPEDFVVEEIPAYEPSGEGDHVFVRFVKRDVTTPDAVKAIAAALGARERDVGVAGMKDKVAVTEQTISLPASPGIEERAMELALPGIRIVAARRHRHKLKTGHLRGNRFTLVLREIEDPGAVLEGFARVAASGVPNAFGEQRFGRDGDNASRARAWLSGKGAAPRDPRLRRLLFSALQSAVFNEVLARRVEDGTWATVLTGDIVRRRDTGGLFTCTDAGVDRERARRKEVSATGPIVGVKMTWPEGEPLALERRVAFEVLGEGIDLAETRALGEGTRRALRLEVDDLRAEREQDSIRVHFVLPKGAYATTVVQAVLAASPASPTDLSFEGT